MAGRGAPSERGCRAAAAVGLGRRRSCLLAPSIATALPPLPAPPIQPEVETRDTDALSSGCATSLIMSLQKCAASGGLAPAPGSACCSAMGDTVQGPCAEYDLQAALSVDSDPESIQVLAQL